MPSTRPGDTDVNHGLVIWNGGELADADVLVEFSVEADEAGWDGVFFGDHLIYPWVSDPEAHLAGRVLPPRTEWTLYYSTNVQDRITRLMP